MLKIRILFILCLISAICVLTSLPARAAEDVKTGYQALSAAISRSDAPAARERMSAASLALYDRVVGYGLMPCLPGDVAYQSSTMEGDVAVTKGTFRSSSGKMQVVNLSFVDEEGQWKLDLPETFQRAFGPKWQQTVGFTEALYLSIRQQSGGKLTCEQIESIGKSAN